MRMIMLASSAALILAGAANAQTSSPERSPPPSSSQQAPAPKPMIKSINVVELDNLPETAKAQVNELVASRSADDIQRLHKAIEDAPAVKTAVEAKGFSSGDVLVAQIDDNGELVVITKRRS